MVVPNFRGIDAAVKELSASLDSYRESVSRIQNRAVFEIPEILATILEKTATL
jgi:1,2-diacylglycerol 3-beta-galactosyltransferase